ncbi:shikimate dehydrogenase [Reinekea sp.]|jgi:shikimate dehydrogenase|uniref:shikimate dehydrogenase n=1 Tax=Reinekea sp. TaxID=1970455 RepID=UPI0039897977
MDRYAVIGHPITHSLSPQIHTLFAAQTTQSLTYEGIELPLTSFETRLWQLIKEGYLGFNVTMPFKGDAFDFVDELTERAKRARAVNTIKILADGRTIGDTTDGVGLLNDLQQHLKWTLEDTHILMLGAGGAVRGVLEPLIEANPASLTLANRTLEKAEELADDFPEITPCSFAELSGRFDLIINGTSASLSGMLPPIPESLINPGVKCYDMMYSAEPTAFLKWATSLGAVDLSDGLGMLVGQAAESFNYWRGVSPEVQPVIDELRQRLTIAT